MRALSTLQEHDYVVFLLSFMLTMLRYPFICSFEKVYAEGNRRLTTSNEILKASLSRLRKILLIRGYKSNYIDHEFTKVYQFTQNDLLNTASLVPKRLKHTPSYTPSHLIL